MAEPTFKTGLADFKVFPLDQYIIFLLWYKNIYGYTWIYKYLRGLLKLRKITARMAFGQDWKGFNLYPGSSGTSIHSENISKFLSFARYCVSKTVMVPLYSSGKKVVPKNWSEWINK